MESAAPQPPNATAPFSRALNAFAAFDLVVLNGQAVLIWADASSLRAAPVAGAGTLKNERVLYRGDDIWEVAAATGTGIGVGWISGPPRVGLDATLTATIVSPEDLEALPPTPLGVVQTPRGAIARSERRGRLAMAARTTGELVVLAQGPRESCDDGSDAMCASFGVHPLPAIGTAPRRPPLTLPNPCPVPIAGFGFGHDHQYIAVCNITGGTEMTTLFAIQDHPAYAQAVDVLPNCRPLGSVFVHAAPGGFEQRVAKRPPQAGQSPVFWLFGRCGERKAGVTATWRAPTSDKVPTIHINTQMRTVADAEIECTADGSMRWVRNPNKAPRVARALADGPVAPLLPLRFAGAGARAVWLSKTSGQCAKRHKRHTFTGRRAVHPSHFRLAHRRRASPG